MHLISSLSFSFTLRDDPSNRIREILLRKRLEREGRRVAHSNKGFSQQETQNNARPAFILFSRLA